MSLLESLPGDRVPPASRREPSVGTVLIAVLVALPFVHPLAPGPVTNTWPMAIAWACAGGLLILHTRVQARHIAAAVRT